MYSPGFAVVLELCSMLSVRVAALATFSEAFVVGAPPPKMRAIVLPFSELDPAADPSLLVPIHVICFEDGS